jgi:hypothetical protein
MEKIGKAKYPSRCYNCGKFHGVNETILYRDERSRNPWRPVCVYCQDYWEDMHKVNVKVIKATNVKTENVQVPQKKEEKREPVQLDLFKK